MVNRQCINCKKELLPQHVGRLCYDCQIKVIDTIGGTSLLHYNIRDLMEIFSITSEEYMRRLSRTGKIPGRVPLVREHLYFRETVNGWIKQHQIIPMVPTSPLQEEAKQRCENDDHDWLFDERFDGIAYTSEDAAKEQSGKVTSTGSNRTCYFCGYSTFISSMYNY